MPRYPPEKSSRLPDDPAKFYRVATQRFAEAQFLFAGTRYAATIYLAGYAVECGLKALILSTLPRGGRKEKADSFRGGGWHSFDRLVDVYFAQGGPRPPAAIARALSFVTDEWSVELRYLPGERPLREAERFVGSTGLILKWVEGRI